MNHKNTLFVLLLLTLIFGLFSARSDVYAKEASAQTETKTEMSKEKADRPAAASTSQESSKISEGKPVEEKQTPSEVQETQPASAPLAEAPKEDLATEPQAPQDSKNQPVEASPAQALPKNPKDEANPEDASSKPEAQDPAKDSGKLEASEEKVEENKDHKKKDPALEAQESEAPKALTAEAEKPKNLYLNGKSGDDTKDGLSPETALKTFGKAKEKAEENSAIENIYVTGTTPVEGEVSLDKTKTKAKLVRDKDFNDYLLSVESGKEATIANITIDGNSNENENIEKSLVQVKEKATLNIQDGAVLRNNKIKAIENTATTGGGVYVYHATVHMTGGTIEENQATYGGGIYLNGSILTFSGGTVQKNTSNRVDDKAWGQIYSAGGGILASEGSTINLSGTAKVSENFAAEIGGGISLGSNQVEKTNILNMDGGIIDGNTAGAAGGGLFIQAKYYSGGPGKAYINSGQITNNKMNGSGKTDKEFGGGGIYVNGAKDKFTLTDKDGNETTYEVNGANGELYLKNVLITDNTSKLQGAGMANCPISKTTIYVNNGVALYENKSTDTPVHDFFILSHLKYQSHSGKAEYDLSKRMLGGAPFNWTTLDGKPLADDMHKGTLDIPEGQVYSFLALNVNSKGNALTQALAKVIISGNYSATRGGGIGSNGTIVIGTEGNTTKVSVEKKWDDKDNARNNRPSTIKVQLVATYKGEDYVVETREVTKDNEWKTTFSNLVTANGEDKITYTVKEVGIKGYESTVTGSQEKGFVITNKEKPEEPKTRDIQVKKNWDLIGSEKPVDKIEVELYRDENSTGKKLELNEGNNWSGVFKNLDIASKEEPNKEYAYTVKEVGENKGLIQFGERTFEVTYEGTMEKGFIITNKEKPKTPPETPPGTPPEEPKEPPKPPEVPPVPPETPPEVPEEPPVIPVVPPKKPSPPRGGAPQTYDPGIGIYLALASMSSFGFYVVRKKKED